MPRFTSLILSLCIAGVLYLTLAAGFDGARTWAAMQRLDVLGWVSILGLSLLNYGLRFIRWHGYMRWLGHRLPLARHAVIYISGFALTTTPGKAGEGLRAVYLAKRGVPYTHSVAALFAERFLDLLAVALWSMLVLIAFSGYVVWVIVPIAALAVFLVALRQRRLLRIAQRRTAAPESFIGRAAQAAVSAWDHAFALMSWKPLYLGLALGLAAWAAEGVALFLIAHRLGLPLNVDTAVGIYAVSMLVGALSFVPGGLGGTEAVMALLLKLTGIGAYTALGITLIARIATLWFAVLLGLWCLAGLELERRFTRPAAGATPEPAPDQERP